MTFTLCLFGSSGGSLRWLSAVWRRPREKCLLQSSSGRGVEVETAGLRSPMRWLSWRCPAATPGWWISSLRTRRIMTSSWCWNSEFTTQAGKKTFLSSHKEPLTHALLFFIFIFLSPVLILPNRFIRNSLLPYSLYQSSNSDLLE